MLLCYHPFHWTIIQFNSTVGKYLYKLTRTKLFLSLVSIFTDTTILDKLNSGGAPTSIEEDIEPEKVGIVIGSKGCIISEIMKKSGAKMIINQEFPKGQPHKITYSGIFFINFC